MSNVTYKCKICGGSIYRAGSDGTYSPTGKWTHTTERIKAKHEKKSSAPAEPKES